MNAAFKHAIRALREHLYLASVSVGVITAALVLVGVYGLIVVNVQGIVSGWQQDVHVSAYFDAKVTPDDQARLRESVATLPEVAAVALITNEQAVAWMTERMPEVRPALSELGGAALPASLEITLRPGSQSPAAMDAFAASLNADGFFTDIDYGREWVERAGQFLKMLHVLGLALGAALGLAALFLVGNTINLVVYARRDELEIMRLVGATDRYILTPFVIEGAIQSTIACFAAFIVLSALHQGVLVRLATVLPIAFDSSGFEFLPGGLVIAMVLGGWFIGIAPAWIAVRRFLAALP